MFSNVDASHNMPSSPPTSISISTEIYGLILILNNMGWDRVVNFDFHRVPEMVNISQNQPTSREFSAVKGKNELRHVIIVSR